MDPFAQIALLIVALFVFWLLVHTAVLMALRIHASEERALAARRRRERAASASVPDET